MALTPSRDAGTGIRRVLARMIGAPGRDLRLRCHASRARIRRLLGLNLLQHRHGDMEAGGSITGRHLTPFATHHAFAGGFPVDTSDSFQLISRAGALRSSFVGRVLESGRRGTVPGQSLCLGQNESASQAANNLRLFHSLSYHFRFSFVIDPLVLHRLARQSWAVLSGKEGTVAAWSVERQMDAATRMLAWNLAT